MMTEETFIHILDLSLICIILTVIFFGSYAIFHAQMLLILGLITIGVYGVVWGGACIADMFSNTKNPIGVVAYIAFAILMGLWFFKCIE